MSGESTITEITNGGASDAPLQDAGLNRKVWRRESALLIALVLFCEALKLRLALAIRFLVRPDVVHALPHLAVTLLLTSMLPFALRINSRLGLPGAPLIAAKMAREKLPFRIRSLLKISAGYALLGLAVATSILFVVLVFIFIAHPGSGRMKLPLSPMRNLAPSRIAIVGTLTAIAAGISEEIEFRLVLFAVFTWIARLITRDSFGASRRGVLWFVTILQGYVFGMLHMNRLVHMLPLAALMLHSIPTILVGGLLMPQTWEGIVLGRLYLRRGLEASMLAHAMIDAALFMLVAIVMSVRVHLSIR
jgi:CAAX prenyl protease-like protein